MLMFVLGRQPEIGLAELSAVFGSKVRLASREIATCDFDEEPSAREFSRLGSVVKVAKVFAKVRDLSHDNLAQITQKKFHGVEGKITLGMSFYGAKSHNSAREAVKIGLELKNILQEHNSVRLVPNDGAALSSAAVQHNHLAGDNPKKVEMVFTRADSDEWLIANTIFVQDIAKYTFRDRGRPRRDARVGMLPPKLAQTMINLASSGKTDARKLLDPFCGTGVVLQEAALMKMNVYGTDLESRMIQYSRENLDWLRRTHHAHFDEELEIGDATSFQWSQPIELIATETYLGKPYSAEPSDDNLRENIANCNVILTKFLKNLATQITPDTGICVAVPCWFTARQAFHLPLIAKLTDLGFEQIFYSDNHENLIYHRENQIVGRELLVLRKKSA